MSRRFASLPLERVARQRARRRSRTAARSSSESHGDGDGNGWRRRFEGSRDDSFCVEVEDDELVLLPPTVVRGVS